MRVIDCVVTGELVVDFTDCIAESVLVSDYFGVGFECADDLVDVDPRVDFVDEVEAEGFEDPWVGFGHEGVRETLREHY